MKRNTGMTLRITLALLVVLALSACVVTQYAQAASTAEGAWTAKAGTGGVTVHRFVKLEAAGTIITATAVGDAVVGVCEQTAAQNAMTTYAPIGTIALVDAGEAIAVGEAVTAGAGGEAFVLDAADASTQRIGGYAMTADDGSGTVKIWIMPGVVETKIPDPVSEIVLAQGSVIVGNAGGVGAALDAKGDGKILVGNGTTITSVSVSGDATLSNAGALTIATGAVEDSMIEGLAAGQFILGVDGTAANNTKVTMSGDCTMAATGAVTIGAGKVTEAMLSTATQDRIAYLTVTGADLANAGTGTITIQAKDAAGNNLAAACLVRTWIGTADDYGADALTDYSVTTGTSKQEVTANGEYLAVTDATGKVIMAVDNGGAGTVYAWAELGGRVYASGAVALTAP
jgi:hypothetical protein